MADTTTADDEKGEDFYVRPFADWLREQSNGKSHEELSDGLWDLIARVRDTGKKGSITFTVTVAPMTKGDDDTLVVTDEIRLKLPEHDRKASLFYADRLGNLSKSDPRQLTFESLREVPQHVDVTTGEIKELKA